MQSFIQIPSSVDVESHLSTILNLQLKFNQNLVFANVVKSVPEGNIWVVDFGIFNNQRSHQNKIGSKRLPGEIKSFYCMNLDEVEFLIMTPDNIPGTFNFPFAITSGTVIHSKNPSSELSVNEYILL